MEAGISDHVWSVEELVALLDQLGVRDAMGLIIDVVITSSAFAASWWLGVAYLALLCQIDSVVIGTI